LPFIFINFSAHGIAEYAVLICASVGPLCPTAPAFVNVCVVNEYKLGAMGAMVEGAGAMGARVGGAGAMGARVGGAGAMGTGIGGAMVGGAGAMGAMVGGAGAMGAMVGGAGAICSILGYSIIISGCSVIILLSVLISCCNLGLNILICCINVLFAFLERDIA
jgi:hypothetical protein